MEVIDAHVHLLESLEPDRLIAQMQEAGVDRALLVNQSKFGGDCSRLTAAASRFPLRLGVITAVDPAGPNIDDQVARLAAHSDVVGLRIVLFGANHLAQGRASRETIQRRAQELDHWNAGGYLPVLAAAQKHRLPVCFYVPGGLGGLATLCALYPSLQVVIDHLNLDHHAVTAEAKAHVFEELQDLLALSQLPNVAVKASGMPAVSSAPYPFCDLWPVLHDVLSVFGRERVMWGTDWTQLTDRCSYREGVRFMTETPELSGQDKAALMGGTLRNIFSWPRERTANRP